MRDFTAGKKEVAELALKSSSWLTRSSAFQKVISECFHKIDKDNSGNVKEGELYTGLLFIHLKLALYAGPAACKAPSEATVLALFKSVDEDNSGTIDKTEFEHIMIILCSQITTRILLQMFFTLVLVRPLTRLILWLFGWNGMKFLDDYLADGRYVKSILTTVPYTITSTLLICVCIPLLLDGVDSYFLGVADILQTVVDHTESESNSEGEGSDTKKDN